MKVLFRFSQAESEKEMLCFQLAFVCLNVIVLQKLSNKHLHLREKTS